MLDDALDSRLPWPRPSPKRRARMAYELWLRRDALAVETKSSRLDMVSEADRSVERAILRRWPPPSRTTASWARNTAPPR